MRPHQVNFVALVAAALVAHSAQAQLVLAPCDAELTAEVQRAETAVATARSEWQAAVATKIAAAGFSDSQRSAFEKSYSEEAAKMFSFISKNLETVAKIHLPLVLPAYSPVLCQRLGQLRDSNDQTVAAYKQVLQGMLEVMDSSIAKAKK
jgi:hypothetical protein